MDPYPWFHLYGMCHPEATFLRAGKPLRTSLIFIIPLKGIEVTSGFSKKKEDTFFSFNSHSELWQMHLVSVGLRRASGALPFPQ